MRHFLKSMDLATAQLAIAKLLGNARLSCGLPPADSLNQNRADLNPRQFTQRGKRSGRPFGGLGKGEPILSRRAFAIAHIA